MNSVDNIDRASGDQKESAKIASILDQMWARFLPDIRQRAAILELGAAALSAGEMANEQREAAHSAAHKLAGILGTFNLMHGTELAREFEQLTARADQMDPALGGRLASIAAELRIIIDSRK